MSVFLQPIQSTLHGKMRGSQDIELSDFFSTTLCNGIENLPVFGKLKVKLLPSLLSELLRVVQPLQRKAIRKDHSSCHDGASKRPPPCLIDPRHGLDTPGVKLPFVEKRRASGFPEALSRMTPATLVRHRDVGKNT